MELLEQDIYRVVKFHSGLMRPLTLLEIFRLAPADVSLSGVRKVLDALCDAERIREERGYYGTSDLWKKNADAALRRLRQDVMADEKWKKFLSLRSLFRHIPFVEFALAAGSMAMGNAKPLSDFDVIVGARKGRIFTARLFCIALFGALGKRRRKITHHDEANNKICLNHFVTEDAYRLSPEYNIYWQQLYRNLVPLYGSRERISTFLKANDWVGAAWHDDRRYREDAASPVRRGMEWLLGGMLGELVERILRTHQMRRIERGIQKTHGAEHHSRLIYNDAELEFHPDTLRIEEMVRAVRD